MKWTFFESDFIQQNMGIDYIAIIPMQLEGVITFCPLEITILRFLELRGKSLTLGGYMFQVIVL